MIIRVFKMLTEESSVMSLVKLWFKTKVIATEFFQRHLIVGRLLNNMLKIRQNPFDKT